MQQIQRKQRKITIPEYIKASEALKSWQTINQGFHKDYNQPEYKIARKFLNEHLKVNDKLFDHKTDVIYLENNCNIEHRGQNKQHRYLKPSKCVKFELNPLLSKFHKSGWQKNQKWGYAFQGTQPSAEIINSILEKGLLPGGSKGVKRQFGKKHGDGIYTTYIPLIAEQYAGAVQFEGKWVRVILKLRINPNKQYQSEKLSQLTFGRDDIHLLYKGIFKPNEMQTIIKDAKDIELQALLIKVYDEKPTPDCKKYKEIADLLTGYNLEKVHEQEQKKLLEEQKQELGIENEDNFLKQQIEMMKLYQRQAQQSKRNMANNLFKNFNFKDDQKIQKFNFSNLKINDVKLEKNIKFNMTPLKQFWKMKKYGKTTIPFICSVNPGKVIIPDHVAQHQFFDHNRAPIDLILALDISGSMAGSKLNTLKETVKLIMGQLNDKDRVSLVTFNHQAQRLTSLKLLSKKNLKFLLQKLNAIKATGDTNIAGAMDIAFNIFKQRRYQNPISSILLLSDGKDEGACERCQQLLEKLNINCSFSVNTFGLGSDHDAVLMDDIAKLKDGAFCYIDKVQSVGNAFSHCIGGLVSIVAKNGQITICPKKPGNLKNASIRISKAYGGNDMWKYKKGNYITEITHLETGSLGKTFVLELEVSNVKNFLQDYQKNVNIAQAFCTIQTTGGHMLKLECALQINLLNQKDKMIDEEDWDVGKHYIRVRTAETIEKAQILTDKDQHQQAKNVLNEMIQIIKNGKYKTDRNGVIGGCEMQKALLKDLNDCLDLNSAAMRQKARGHMQERSNYDGGQEHYHSYNYE